MFGATISQIENCAVWNTQEAEIALRNAASPKTPPKDRDYWARRAERLDMQSFRLFRRAHELKALFKHAA